MGKDRRGSAMRQNKFIVTKDHFIMLAASNENQDELWAGYDEFKNSSFSPKSLSFIIKILLSMPAVMKKG